MSTFESGGAPSGVGRRIRSLLFSVHRWIGLHICLFLGLVFLSGTLSLLVPELDVGLRPDIYIAPGADAENGPSPGDFYDLAVAQNPDATIRKIIMPKRPWFGHAVEMDIPDTGVRKAWFRPDDGAFIGYTRHSSWSLGQLVRTFHENLLVSHRLASLAVTSMVWVVMLMVITGLITYRRFWRGFFRWPARGTEGRMRHGALHRLMGVWSFPFLTIIAVSGLVFFLSDIHIGVSWPPVYATEQRPEILPEGFNGQSVDAFIAATQSAVPGFKLDTLFIPGNDKAFLQLLGTDTAYGEMVGTVLHKYHPVTMELLADEQVSIATTGHWLTGIGISLHYGTFGGLFTEALWLIFGFVSCYLLLTGARIFASRIVAERHGEAALEGKGTFAILIQGLGIFKWGYALLPVAIILANVVKVLI